ncbi:MAG: hypothetical protein KKG99_03630 [Bacteroidetes bacterium]|nr:hypothetical protein [Bacteroidota bacterium]
MKSKILWLRISYWIAALADFGIAIAVLIPEKMGLTEFVYPMGLMSATAFSWGILLLIADRKPLERRWILIPTIFVVVLLTAVRIYASINHLIDFSIGYIILGVFIFLLTSYSYYISRNLNKQN